MPQFSGKVEPDAQLITIEDGKLVVRFPIPPEEALLEMLYAAREKKMPTGMVLQVDFDEDFVCELLEASGSTAGTWTKQDGED